MTIEPIRVVVNDLMQRKYVYYRTEPVGKNFHPEFKPQLTPKQMLELGVFGGKYMTDCANEFPDDWFDDAKLCAEKHDPEAEPLRRQRVAAAFSVAREGLDPRRRPARLVPMVLPLLHGPPLRRRRSADQTLECCEAARRANSQELPARRSQMPPPATAGAAALGL